MTDNPYAPPSAEEVLAEDSAEEAIRRAHINHEASVRSIGLLNYLGVFLTIVGIFTGSKTIPPAPAENFGYVLGMLLLPLILFYAGYSVRRLRRPGQVLNTLIYGPTLVIFPFGTLIGLIVLYFLFCKKGRMIFSAPYRDIVRNTPHIKYRRSKTSKAAWIILVIFLLFLLVGIFLAASR